jgi:homoserine O-acetyltransferase
MTVAGPQLVAFDEALSLDAGPVLDGWRLAYESWGRLDADGRNAILICRALTSNCHVTSAGRHGAAPGWWEQVVGPGKVIDTDRFFVVCMDTLAGLHGSSGPSTPQPGSNRPYGMRFPPVTFADSVRAQRRLAEHLGIRRFRMVAGGCVGAMQALQWGLDFPEMVGGVAAISIRMAPSAYALALWSVVRRAIQLDPEWRGGDYYDGPAPGQGLGLATVIGLLHWMDMETFEARYGRRRRSDAMTFDPDFEVEHMLAGVVERAGGKVDPNSMIYTTRAADYFDVTGRIAAIADGRGRPPHLVMNYSRDIRYPPEEGGRLADALGKAGIATTEIAFESPIAHGGFLIDQQSVLEPIANFMASLDPG